MGKQRKKQITKSTVHHCLKLDLSVQEEEQTKAALDQSEGYMVWYPDPGSGPLCSLGGDARCSRGSQHHLRLNVEGASS